MKQNKIISAILFFIILLLSSCMTVTDIPEGLLECDVTRYPANCKVHYPDNCNIMLFNAVKAGNLDLVDKILNKPFCKANINVSDRLGQSALMWACWIGNTEMINKLLDIDMAKRKDSFQKKYWTVLDYSANSREEYHPLFCLIMSEHLTPDRTIPCIKHFLANEKNYRREEFKEWMLKLSFNDFFERLFYRGRPSIFKRDYYQETVFHKAVRSGWIELLKFFLNLSDDSIYKRYINETNIFGETPLMLAVKMQNLSMVKELIDNSADITIKDRDNQTLAENAFADGNGNYFIFLEVMKANLKMVREYEKNQEQLDPSNNRIWKREDLIGDLDNKIGAKIGISHLDMIKHFKKVCDKYSGNNMPKVNNPEELGDKDFQAKINSFFERLTGKDIDIEMVKKDLNESEFLIQSRQEKTNKTVLEICIENGNIDLFDTVFKYVNVDYLGRPGGGCGDYLVCAIVNHKVDIIRYLLDYSNRFGIKSVGLLSPNGEMNDTIAELCGGTHIPLVYAVKNDIIWNDESEDLLFFYKPSFENNANYAGHIYNAALARDDEAILLKLYELSNIGSSFYAVDKITVNDTEGRPTQYELLERGYYNALALYIENSNFAQMHYELNDTKLEQEKSFQELLEERLLDNNPDIQKIVDILKKKGLWIDKSEEETKKMKRE